MQFTLQTNWSNKKKVFLPPKKRCGNHPLIQRVDSFPYKSVKNIWLLKVWICILPGEKIGVASYLKIFIA